jgi:hypothetical protein
LIHPIAIPITMAYKFTAQATGATDDDIVLALEIMIKQIQDGFTSGLDSGEDRDFSWSMIESCPRFEVSVTPVV